VTRGVLRLNEGLKDLRLLLIGHANAGVTDADFHSLIVFVIGSVDAYRTLLGKFGGIAQ
jgi:hypothetical protein